MSYARVPENDETGGVPQSENSFPVIQPQTQQEIPVAIPVQQQAMMSPMPAAVPGGVPMAMMAQPGVPMMPPQQPIPVQLPVVVSPIPPTQDQLQYTLQNRVVQFNVCRYFNEAWTFARFNIWVILGWSVLAGIVLIAVSFGARALASAIVGGDRYNYGLGEAFLIWFIGSFLPDIFITYPVVSGFMYAVFQAMRKNAKLTMGDTLWPFTTGYFLRLVGLVAVRTMMIDLGLLLLIVPGIYLFLITIFVQPLHQEHGFLGIWGSIKASTKAVHKSFCWILLLLICLALLNVAGALLFLLPLVFTIPYSLIVFCYTYHALVGVNGVAIMVPAQAACLNAQQLPPNLVNVIHPALEAL